MSEAILDNICNITADNMSTNVPEPLLSLKDITYAYNTPKDEIPALDGICLDIAPGSFTSFGVL